MSDDNDKLTGHNYDGIEEYDNPLPNWWLATFFLTVIFAYIYWLHYESGTAVTQLEELKADMARIELQQKNAPIPQDNEEDLIRLLSATEIVQSGKNIYAAKCAACHGPELQGLIGPNLVDEYWIHTGGRLSGIANVVRKGVVEKGMPSWQGLLKEDEITAVVVFIGSSQGTHPSNPKPPQGDKIVKN
jgi:cytochrome c oxidase cbb3-type subunit III